MVPAEEQDWKDVKRKKKKKNKKNNKSEPAVQVNEPVPQTIGNSDVKNFQNNSIILHQQTIAPVFEYDAGDPEYTEASNDADDYTDDEFW